MAKINKTPVPSRKGYTRLTGGNASLTDMDSRTAYSATNRNGRETPDKPAKRRPSNSGPVTSGDVTRIAPDSKSSAV